MFQVFEELSTDNRQNVLADLFVGHFVQQDQEHWLDVDLLVQFLEIADMHTEHPQVGFDFVRCVQEEVAAVQVKIDVLLLLEFEEVRDYFSGASAGCRHEEEVFEEAAITHAPLPVLLVVEGLAIVVDALPNEDAELVPEDVGEDYGDFAEVEEVDEDFFEGVAGEEGFGAVKSLLVELGVLEEALSQIAKLIRILYQVNGNDSIILILGHDYSAEQFEEVGPEHILTHHKQKLNILDCKLT